MNLWWLNHHHVLVKSPLVMVKSRPQMPSSNPFDRQIPPFFMVKSPIFSKKCLKNPSIPEIFPRLLRGGSGWQALGFPELLDVAAQGCEILLAPRWDDMFSTPPWHPESPTLFLGEWGLMMHILYIYEYNMNIICIYIYQTINTIVLWCFMGLWLNF